VDGHLGLFRRQKTSLFGLACYLCLSRSLVQNGLDLLFFALLPLLLGALYHTHDLLIFAVFSRKRVVTSFRRLC